MVTNTTLCIGSWSTGFTVHHGRHYITFTISIFVANTVLLCRCGPLARYIKLRVAHAPGMPGTFSPPPRVSDPDMHHGTCVKHVPWCIPGSLTSDFLWSRWRRKHSRHSRRMRNPQFYESRKRPMRRGYFYWSKSHTDPFFVILLNLIFTANASIKSASGKFHFLKKKCIPRSSTIHHTLTTYSLYVWLSNSNHFLWSSACQHFFLDK